MGIPFGTLQAAPWGHWLWVGESWFVSWGSPSARHCSCSLSPEHLPFILFNREWRNFESELAHLSIAVFVGEFSEIGEELLVDEANLREELGRTRQSRGAWEQDHSLGDFLKLKSTSDFSKLVFGPAPLINNSYLSSPLTFSKFEIHTHPIPASPF